MELLTAEEWDQFTDHHPETHILQTSTWGKLKADFGWSPRFVRQGQAGAMVLLRNLPLGLKVAYIPRGPVGGGDWTNLWRELDEYCQQEHCVFLRVEPHIWQPIAEEGILQKMPGFIESHQSVQPPRTIIINIEESEDEILMAMKSKTRYNIRLADRKNVMIQKSADVKTFHQMMLTTSKRDEFGVHSLAYYQRAYELFSARDACVLLIAKFEGQPLGGLIAFAHGNTAWYFYGASTNQERNRMPTYLLQWEAILWAKNRGCKAYDLWGVPDYPETVLEETFLDRSEGLWGVYRFKRGFGGDIQRTVGTWDKVYRPLLYKVYQLWANRRTPPST